MKKDEAAPEAEVVPEGFTEEDLRLGRKTVKNYKTICKLVILFCVVTDFIAFMYLPLGAIAPGETKYGGRYALWMCMAVVLLGLYMLGWGGKKQDRKTNHHMKHGSRVGTYVLGGGLVGLLLWAQVFIILDTMQVYGVFDRQ